MVDHLSSGVYNHPFAEQVAAAGAALFGADKTGSSAVTARRF